ncbi:hypothetical protein [Priestia megaterium]|uniref:hypothetical protein n=1 Tax=Priestia megaterium TaxID=1404 RepID=UPI0024696B30|nr:hypothetical protein [Priestia megaterium]
MRTKNFFGENFLEDAIEFFNKMGYIRGFFKGFNLNKVDENLDGIYVLRAKEEDGKEFVLYVGESTRMKNRIRTHIKTHEKIITSVEVTPFAKEMDRKQRLYLEKIMINFHQPRLNLQNTRKDFFDTKIILERTDIEEEDYDKYSFKELQSK